MKTILTWKKFFLILLVTLLALAARLEAVEKLPIDYDEDDYLAAGQRYLQAYRQGSWTAIIQYGYNFEHPPLTKMIDGLVQLPFPDSPWIPEGDPAQPIASSLPQPQYTLGRLVSALWGTLEVLALGLVNPLAGLILGLNNWQIKYTSQIMLEPLPALTSLLTVLCYSLFRQKRHKVGWLCASAVMLGITAACKYTYCIVGVAILIDWLAGRRQEAGDARRLKGLLPVLAWGLLSIGIFVAADPRLWVDPMGRLKASLLYHGGYATSQYVRNAGFPLWQPLVWLTSPPPWHPGVFWLSLEMIYFILAVMGFRTLWKEQRVQALWLGIGLAFLLVWPTKWPQYILTITAPFSLSAARGFDRFIWQPLLQRWLNRKEVKIFRAQAGSARQKSWKELRRAWPWLLPGIVGLTLITLFPLVFQFAMSLTDYSGSSIFDGMQGGIWREVWLGFSGQAQPVAIGLFEQGSSGSRQVHYAGFDLIFSILSAAGSSLLVFEIIWTVLSVITQLALGLGLAWILDKKGLFLRGWWRAIFILPWAIPEFVGVLVWSQIFDPQFGWASAIAKMSHRPEYAVGAWQQDPQRALMFLLIAALWYGFPLIFVAASAGLKAIPAEVYDAAALDGAGEYHTFTRITFPMLLPLLAPAIILRSIYAFNQFYLFFMMQTEYPVLTLSTISYYVFSYGQQYAVSAAINIVTVLFLLAMILLFNRWSKAAEGVTYV